MADVLIGLKILPKDVNTDLDKLEEKVKQAVKPERIERVPIAFGLVSINIIKIVQDAEGEVEKLENKLKTIEEVGGVEVTGITRSF